MINIGQKAPTIKIKDENGNLVSIKDYLGKYLVLYFYPKDDTPGCTVEACNVRDYLGDIKRAGAMIVGVSKDSQADHQKFIKKFDLNFPLWSDKDRKLIEKFGVWEEKSMYGKKYMGIVRSTFIIDPKGVVVHTWPKVTPKDHGLEILEKLKELMKK
jgi:thioredoxin-dependent peroxiredoxin